MSAKGRLLRLFRRFLTEADVVAVEELSSRFRLVRLKTDAPADWQPGDKVQVLLPSDDVRTYTPFAWTPEGTLQLLAYVHAETPASRWAREVKAGERVGFVGPQRSLGLPPGPVALVGDETSIALAASYRRERSGDVRCIFELGEGLDATPVLTSLGLEDAVVVRRGAAASALAEALTDVTGPVGLTGGGDLIQRAREVLRARGVREIKTKAYWVEGKAGLD